MNKVLARWNGAERDAAVEEISACCGSRVWAETMAARRPFCDVDELLQAARNIWWDLSDTDWLEAFRSHPRIGQVRAAGAASARSREWSSEEQRKVADGGGDAKAALVEGNRLYEERFGRIFIVCAAGKSPSEILQILRQRLQNDDAAEMREAADEQSRITDLRVRKWFGE
ncbi:MAG: 2-oxo-4-hydroxy-4-carboxy-5-ureidoimidazoline decarboxylase [Candidatus Acidiferrum sp.]|jgi:2-oxo-4-hydroxy-4-carboxy-5-ureidoimidazoline decarboxylase